MATGSDVGAAGSDVPDVVEEGVVGVTTDPRRCILGPGMMAVIEGLTGPPAG